MLHRISQKSGKLIILAWTALIFLTSGLPETPGEALIPHFHLIGHFTQFFILAVLSATFLSRGWKKTLLLAGFIALSAEIYQLFLPWRAFEWLDLLVDFFGVAAGLVYHKIVLNNIDLINY